MSWNLGAGLEGRGIIVVGATGGIGSEVCRALDAAGTSLLLVDRDEDRLSELFSELEGEGHSTMVADLADPQSPHAIAHRAASELRTVYGLVNTAAELVRTVDIEDVTQEEWDRQLDVNLRAAFFLSRAAAQLMIGGEDGGRIVLFGSQAWWTGGVAGSMVYAASKGGLVSMARGLARNLGPNRITVNVVSPGLVETTMLRKDLPDRVYNDLTTATPLGYVARPEEMVGTVVFLLSQHADYITGATINISGGLLMY